MTIARLRKLAVGLSALTAALTVTAAGASTAHAAGAFNVITNAATHLCAKPQLNAESSLVLARCPQPADNSEDARSARWLFQTVRGNFGHLVNQAGLGLCVYMNGPVSSGSPVIQTGCSDVSNEDWIGPVPNRAVVTTIKSRAGHRETNLCLAPESLQEGALLRIFTCVGGDTSQQWFTGP
ncbi:RICIN domain-containing protein [Amycolatopsis sp. H6(2020)]|nr:RICIN domain-containing protein [Amycolatopsis sp. H6(2020)]